MSTRKLLQDWRRPAFGLETIAGRTAAKRGILIVDQHPLTLEGLTAVVNRQPDFAIEGVAGDADEALGLLSEGRSELMITEIALPGWNGIELIQEVAVRWPELPILVLSVHDESLYGERAWRAGARGYLTKSTDPAMVIAGIRCLLGGQCHWGSGIPPRILRTLGRSSSVKANLPIASLTQREFEVFCLFGHGGSTREVAHSMGLSSKTVEAHRGRMMKKLQIKDAASLFYHAVRWVATQGSPSS